MALDAVVLFNCSVSFFTGCMSFGRVINPGKEGIRKSFWRVWIEGGAATCGGHDFRECTMVRLNHWDACCHGFDSVETKGFTVAGGDRDYCQVS